MNATLENEFAAVGYRAHSQIHGEMEPVAPAGRYTAAQLTAFRAQGIEVEEEDGDVDATHARVVAAGFRSKKEPYDAFWGQRYAQVIDPDDNAVDLFAPLPNPTA